MADKYKPILDLIMYAEGTSKKRTPKAEGYNTTLGYGAYTGGSVDLVSMTLDEVDALQTRMLRHPRNVWNSSAAGAYQIVRTTRRKIQNALGIPGNVLFNEATQDRMAKYLLGYRGIDKWLEGKISDNQILLNLSKEWASFPKPNGKGYYSNQEDTPITPADVLRALDEVRDGYAYDVLDEKPKDEAVARAEEHWFIRLLRILFRSA